MKKLVPVFVVILLFTLITVISLVVYSNKKSDPKKENTAAEANNTENVRTTETPASSPAAASNQQAGPAGNSVPRNLAAVPSDPQTSDAGNAPAEAPDVSDNIVTTQHTAVIKGNPVSYTADTGTMVLQYDGNYYELFFTAYTVDGGDASRPITFAFNGGPGSCSEYIHMGCLGPRRVALDDEGKTISMPDGIVDNENSVLDMTDLVFVDPVGTGYSRALTGTNADFYGYDNDIASIAEFIRLYVNRHNRWGSPKYIAGESYGTTRAVGLCKYLADNFSMNLNGLMLISSVNDFKALIEYNYNELPYATGIPTYAADAWYHKKVSAEYQAMSLEEYIQMVRQFAEKELVPALFAGKSISDSEKEELAGKISAYLGVSKEFVLSNNLRIGLDDFLTELLKDEKLVVGRYDGRITGPATGGSIDSGEADPSDASVNLAFGNTFMAYITTELGFQTDVPYRPTADDIDDSWPFADDDGLIAQEDILYECISKNPFLKVWVLCGYYDGATPFYSAEWTYNHVFLLDDYKDNIHFTYYPSGHMIYINKEAFDKLRKDAEEWYQGQ